VSDAVHASPSAVENPRTTRVRKIVIDAAIILFMEEGYRAVTPYRVSQVTGVARSTSYRHWPNQEALLLDTIDVVVHPHFSSTVVGDLGTDLTTALDALRRRLEHRPFRAIFTALLEHANRSDKIVPVQRRFVTGVIAPIRDIIEGAIEQGRLDVSVSPDEAAAQLTGPVFQQHVMVRTEITDELIAATVEGFIATNRLRARRIRRGLGSRTPSSQR